MTTMQVLAHGWRETRRAAKAARSARSGRPAAGVLVMVGRAVGDHGLAVLGLGAFVAAGLLVAVPLGLAVAGVACFVLELRVSSE